MRKKICAPERSSSQAGRFIKDAVERVICAAEQHRTIHLSQSFAGTESSAATIVSIVTCPNELALEMQYAIDVTVRELLAEHGSKPLTVQ